MPLVVFTASSNTITGDLFSLFSHFLIVANCDDGDELFQVKYSI